MRKKPSKPLGIAMLATAMLAAAGCSGGSTGTGGEA